MVENKARIKIERWIIIDVDGTYLGTVKIEPGLNPTEIILNIKEQIWNENDKR